MATALVIGLVAVVAFRLFPLQEVTVLTNGQSFEVNATFDPREEGLAAAAVDVSKGDTVLLATAGRHASVAVQRAAEVAISADGSEVFVRTQATTVGGALAAAGVFLRPRDRLYLGGQLTTASAPLAAGPLVSSAPHWSAGASEEAVQVVVARSKPVTVYLDQLRIETESSAPTVGGVLSDLGLTVREGDLVQPALDALFSAGMTVRLAKAKTLTVNIDGEQQSLYTLAGTVEDVLEVLGIVLGPEDTVVPAPGTALTDGETVSITLTRIVEEDVELPLPAPVRYETDGSLPPGTVRIINGSDGARVVRYRVVYRGGKEVSRESVSSSVARDPVPTRHISSSRSAATTRPTLSTPDYSGPYVRKLTVITTWYNASHGGKSPDDPWYGITATGMKLDYGVCAVDPAVIPLGTAMYIPKYGRCIAADVGGGIRGNHVDLGFPESAGPNPWGVETLDIYILP